MNATRLLSPALALSFLFVCSAAMSQSRYGQDEPEYGAAASRDTSSTPPSFRSVLNQPSSNSRPNYWQRDDESANYAQPNNSPSHRQQLPSANPARNSPLVPAEVHGKLDFGIPFDLAAQEDTIGQVRLYVSTDQGRDWQLYDHRTPNAKGFQFRAQAEGEYWFAVRTTNRNGQQTSANPTDPELRVIVDTTQPRMDLRVNADAQGRVVAEWQAQDEHLLPETFRLFYQDERGAWQQVRPQPQQAQQLGPGRLQGGTQWSQRTNSNELIVVAEIQDEAENLTRVRKRVSVGGAQNATQPGYETQETASARGGGSTGRPGAAGGSWSDIGQGIRNFFGGGGQPDAATHGASQPTVAPRGFSKPSTPPFNQVSARTNSNPSLQRSPVASPVGQRNPRGFAEPQFVDPRSQEPRNQEPQYAARPGPSQSYSHAGHSSNAARQPRITSSPNFEIDYEIQGVGERGAKRVELWFTRDEGHTWELYGSDPDQRTPMEVQLRQEGMYGFRLAVHGHDGPAPKPPEDNSPADVWVAADWTKPVGRITRAMVRDAQSRDAQTYGRGEQELVVQWVAQDALLDETPILLNIAASADGPWYPIASPMHNKGSHTWKIDRELPARLYVQMQIRDIAGNITSTVYDVTAAGTGGAPSAQILDIRPPSKSAFRPGNYR